MPADKLMKLFIIQAVSSFVANDYESGVHYLEEIKATYAEKMSQLNPTLKTLAKEIIQSVDLFNPESEGAFGNVEQRNQPQQANSQSSGQQNQQPSSVTSELQDLLKRRKAERKQRKESKKNNDHQ